MPSRPRRTLCSTTPLFTKLCICSRSIPRRKAQIRERSGTQLPLAIRERQQKASKTYSKTNLCRDCRGTLRNITNKKANQQVNASGYASENHTFRVPINTLWRFTIKRTAAEEPHFQDPFHPYFFVSEQVVRLGYYCHYAARGGVTRGSGEAADWFVSVPKKERRKAAALC